jgi:hypothetical protein
MLIAGWKTRTFDRYNPGADRDLAEAAKVPDRQAGNRLKKRHVEF